MVVSKGRQTEIMATDAMTDRLPAQTTFLPLDATWGLLVLDILLASVVPPILPLPLEPSFFLVMQVHPGGQASMRRAEVSRQRRRIRARRLIHIDRLAPCHILHSTCRIPPFKSLPEYPTCKTEPYNYFPIESLARVSHKIINKFSSSLITYHDLEFVFPSRI